jgi:hypothetical protein
MMCLGRTGLWAALLISLTSACSKSSTEAPANPAAGASATTPAASVARNNIATVEPPPAESPPPITPKAAETQKNGATFLEFGEEQVGVNGFQELPRKIRQVADDECGFIGKPIPLSAPHSQLWVATATKNCMGSGGTYMDLILDVPGDKPTAVLTTLAVGGIKLDLATTHHNLPDAFVETASNCCGLTETGYRIDGKEYREASLRLEYKVEQLSSDTEAVEVSRIAGARRSDRCVPKEVSLPTELDKMGPKLVDATCDDTGEASVWLIKRADPSKEVPAQILAREDLLRDSTGGDLVIQTVVGVDAIDIIFPSTKNGPGTWHVDKTAFKRMRPAPTPESGITHSIDSPQQSDRTK